MDNAITNKDLEFVEKIRNELIGKKKHNKTSLEKIALSYLVEDKTKVKELTEMAIVSIARQIARNFDLSPKQRFDRIVELYESQTNLSHRTSQSIMLQQYSTPAPIAFCASEWCFENSDLQEKSWLFEPSAGNGMLTIAFPTKQVIVNEIDELRNSILQQQSFFAVTKIDSSEYIPMSDQVYDKDLKLDCVITNPPFGVLEKPVIFDDYPIKSLEQLMALRGLDLLKDNGKAAIIIGGHTEWDKHGRIQAGKNRIFFNYLYNHYYVDDVINIDGQLYSKQGTQFNIRLILISGRKDKPQGAAPLFNPKTDYEVKDFETLYSRVFGNNKYLEDKKFQNYYRQLVKINPQLPENHPLMICNKDSSQFKEALFEYFENKKSNNENRTDLTSSSKEPYELSLYDYLMRDSYYSELEKKDKIISKIMEWIENEDYFSKHNVPYGYANTVGYAIQKHLDAVKEAFINRKKVHPSIFKTYRIEQLQAPHEYFTWKYIEEQYELYLSGRKISELLEKEIELIKN